MVEDPAFGSGLDFNWEEFRPSHFVDALPVGIDISRIRQLRIELQLSGLKNYDPNMGLKYAGSHWFRPHTWVPFRMMSDLKSLQIFVTFRGDRRGSQRPHSIGRAKESKELFERCWRILPAYTNTMRDLVAAIPKHIETVTWGLTKEQKIKGDYGGHAYVKGCVLRKMYSTFEGLRGIAVCDAITRPDLYQPDIVRMRVDGDGNNSDEDEE